VLDNDGTLLGDLAPRNAEIGQEITDPGHQGPRPGYIYTPEGNRYDWETYDEGGDKGSDWESTWTTRQIFAVNTGVLEVWWSTVDSDQIQWPSYVRRYNAVWPSQPGRITIASTQGSGPIEETVERNIRLYIQNDPAKPGFNPNDEHALLAPSNRLDGQSADGRSVFALRDDLGSSATSLPYVLLKYRDASNKWRFHVYEVRAEDNQYRFSYPRYAGQPLQPPYPLSILQLSPENSGVSGPFWKDRKDSFWARAAGNDDKSTNIVLRFHYPVQPGFFFPASSFALFPANVAQTNLPSAGSRFPWLAQRPNATPGVPTDVAYVISWPANYPTLSVGETVTGTKGGIPNIADQTSVEILYDQALIRKGTPNVQLIDALREIVLTSVDLSSAATLAMEADRGIQRFTLLPPQLRSRLVYNPQNQTLSLAGEIIKPTAGESYILLNVLTKREVEILNGLSPDSVWRTAVSRLQSAAATPIVVPPNTPFTPQGLALTAGNARGPGWVTLAFGSSTNLTPSAEPVSVQVIRVDCPRYVGELKPIAPESPIDEKFTLRHSGDFAGRADQYDFEWRTLPPDSSGGVPNTPRDQWTVFVPKVAAGFQPGQGALDITIEGAGIFTLSDNYFTCRYRPRSPDDTCAPWSEWTSPMLVPGWIKRALQAINPFEQRVKDFANHGVDTLVSMISQAGARYRGDIPFNAGALNRFGLIEIYETILKRGITFSIDADLNYGPANDALLLAAGRLSDLYSLLGNEAYADASDPTIAFGTEGQYGAEATSIHCFMDQTSSLLEEELALLRGRDDHLQPPVTTYPVYNRLIWNFTKDKGEVAYAQNYDIRDRVSQDPETGAVDKAVVDGRITEADAAVVFPQGHGDAWGHYLTAVTGYYQLLRNSNFSWIPRPEAVLVGGVPVSVDFYDERKFAAAAAAKARTGAEIVSLTYRAVFTENPAEQWSGYPDGDGERAWGLSDWGSRAGQGAYFDWVLGNAILPASSPKTGIEKIDRTTVGELRDIAAAYDEIQAQVDKADQGLNPLGLPSNVLPFDIDPNLVFNPQAGTVAKTHFEQIYERAVTAMNNAIAVFNHANGSSQLLRRQADSFNDFQKNLRDREADLSNRLIEAFGYPYPDDMGAGKTYPQGYDGPDLYHYMYSDPSALLGQTNYTVQEFSVGMRDVVISNSGAISYNTNQVKYHVSSGVFGLVKPPEWRSQRRAPGEIQRTHGDLLQAKGRFDRAQREYDNLLEQIDSQAALLRAQYRVNTEEIALLNIGKNSQESLNQSIKRSREAQIEFQTKSRAISLVANAMAEAWPKNTGFIAGLAAGIIGDFTSGPRSAVLFAASTLSEMAAREGNRESLTELSEQQAKESASAANNIQLTTLRQEFGIQQQLQQLTQLIRQEASLRLELFTTQEAMIQAAGAYQASLARAVRLLEDRVRLRQDAAAEVQTRRYNDMSFRIFRNEALQKYRAQFDMAALYVYLAAKAYDFETNLRPADKAAPGQEFIDQIVQARTIGLISGGSPQTGARGDSGLADPMARMSQNFQVLKGQLGFVNPQSASRNFSLRNQLFRILSANGPASSGKAWREKLASFMVANLPDVPEVRRYCLFQPSQAREPGLVIPFSTTIDQDLNFFGWPAGAGDSSFSATAFSTKIRTVGVSFSNYRISGPSGLRETVNVYLIPVGNDIMRSPRSAAGDDINYTRTWRVQDEWLPLPFKLSGKGDARLASSGYIPLFNLEFGQKDLGLVRAHDSFQASHDSITITPDNANDFLSGRLIGRSVWNTRWLLVIPAVNLLTDRNEGLQRFIYGGLKTNGERDHDGVSDIRIQFRAYSFPGR